ncbi:MAG: large conductance mechanosensitive channel protein MscL [Pseudomonadota bacterium]|nr:large conductance mechanosensitive channel protein MscL [Pseudomonadota bacterium]
MLKEFKAFIMRGNVMDLAVGVIIGAAFSAIVSSLTDDVIMPVIGLLVGGLDFSNYFVGLSGDVTANTLEEAREQGAVLAYGSFISAVVKFLIIGWAIFIMVKAINRIMPPAPPPPKPGPTPDQQLLTEIRDLLARDAK